MTEKNIPQILPGRYRHYKGGEYEVVGAAKYSEDPEKIFVVYRALYGEGQLWVRPADMWCELVTVNGEQIPRFRRIEE